MNTLSYARHYNALPSLAEANLALSSSPYFEELIETVKEILVSCKLEACIGLRLIHKHFSVEKDQVAVEEFQNVEGVPSLVTSPHPWKKAIKKGALPSSWIVSDEGDVNVFEASLDPAVKTATKLIEKNSQFFDKIKQALQKHNLHRVLSIAILERDSLVANKDQFYIEVKESEDHRNILQLQDRQSQEATTAVSTAWSFKTGKRAKLHAACAP